MVSSTALSPLAECSPKLHNKSSAVHESVPYTSLDKAVDQASEKQKEWSELPLRMKLDLLNECRTMLTDNEDELINLAMERRHFVNDDSFVYRAENVLVRLTSTMQTRRWIEHLIYTLKSCAETSMYPKPKRVVSEESCVSIYLPFLCDQAIEDVDLIMRTKPQNVVDLQEIPPDKASGISVVVGAASYDAAMDLLTALFVLNSIAIYNMYPGSEAITQAFYKVFRPIASRGYILFCKGSLQDAKCVLYDHRVTSWLMTGGSPTAYKILYGQSKSPFEDRPMESVSNDEIRQKVLCQLPDKIIFELGNVSPYVICPDELTDEEMELHVRHLAFGLLLNGGHICVHPQIILTSKKWPQREQFFRLLKSRIEKSQFFASFYPRAKERYQQIKESLIEEGSFHPGDEWVDGKFIFVRNCATSSVLLREESFCHISGEVCLDDGDQFLQSAIQLCNNSIKGSLGVTIISKKNINQYLSTLHYGVVSVNLWVILAALCPHGLWGASPGASSLSHLGSGLGFFGNCFHFKSPLQSIVIAPIISSFLKDAIYPVDEFELKQIQKAFSV